MDNHDREKWRLESIIESTELGTWEWHIQTGKTIYSSKWAEFIGYTIDELGTTTYNTWVELTHPSDFEKAESMLESYFAGETPSYNIEFRMKHKKGYFVWIHARGKVITWSKDGKPLIMFGTHDDIAKQKQAEKELRDAQILLKASIESPKDIIILAIDKAYRYLYFNKVHKQVMIYAYNQEVEVGMNILDCITVESDRLNAFNNYGKAIAGEVHSTIEVYGDNNKSYYETFYNPIYNEHKKIIGATAYAMNITKRKLAEQEIKQTHEELAKKMITLKESEAKYSAAFKASPDSININAMDGEYIDINDGFTAMSGYTREDVIGKSSSELDIWHIPEDRTKLVKGLQENGWVENLESTFRTKNGRLITGLMSARIINIDNISHILSITRDITERKHAESAILEERERLAVTLRSIGDGVITTDIYGKVVIMNKVAEELTGWQQLEAKGQPISSIFKIINEATRDPHVNPVEKVISLAKIVELENHTVLISKDGTERIIADSGAPIKDRDGNIIGVVLVFRDMTEKQKLLDNIQRFDKLESLGILAGGIAHDFNNLFGGIFGYIDLAKIGSEDNPLVTKYLDKALTVFERAKDLTQQLLTFSKGGIPKRKTGQLAELIKQYSAFVLSGTNIKCDYHIPEDLWLCDFDENQIGQVVDNIIINAQQSMIEGGTIDISLSNVIVSIKDSYSVSPGKYIKISISDTGAGIPQDIMKHMFDPFFSTKQKGNGLGLATCYSIIQKHDGYIDVNSVVGEGSSFHIYLPASDNEEVIDTDNDLIRHQGVGSIIVMDDEDFMREVVGEMVREMGYSVIEVNSGEEALLLSLEAKTNHLTVSGALVDLTIPGGLGGKEVIDAIRKLFPDIPIFASSGFSENPIMARPNDYGFTDSIQKPFRKNDLMALFNKYMK
ncbi:MAG: PAS domain S-box protein [Vallitaleaceae bacterium]|nr:PAS domain S-box protein [Vallitaleaceae bacterium]